MYNNLLINKIGFILFEKAEDGSTTLGLDWSKIETVIEKGLKIIFILVAMWIGIKIGNSIINRFVDKQVKSKLSFSMDEQKAITIASVLKSALKYGVYFSGFSTIIFDNFKVSGEILAVGGFAIGIGAQSLVKDLINGFFILFEDQYGVGDHVTIGIYEGIVEDIGIRTTILRDFTGDLHTITNGAVLEVTNHSRGDIRFIVDVEIAYEENIDNALKLITNVCNKFEEKYKEDLRGAINVLGVTALNASGISIRVIGRAKPLSQWEMERELRKDIKLALDDAGVEIPYPKTQIINIKKDSKESDI
ncbi:MAG: mechanosensitive ion channel family protein [Terrisporobacter sp.]|uniref:mechanosensitive ion channel family protein n=1 Tax=Clostridia TaxID=186801 RepID=UPI002FCBE98C